MISGLAKSVVTMYIEIAREFDFYYKTIAVFGKKVYYTCRTLNLYIVADQNYTDLS